MRFEHALLAAEERFCDNTSDSFEMEASQLDQSDTKRTAEFVAALSKARQSLT